MRNNKLTSVDEETLRLVLESAPSALLMVDAEGAIALANLQAVQLFGYSREELLGRPVDMLLPERYRRLHPGQRSGFFANPSKRAMGAGRDLYGLHKDGNEVPVEIGLTPIQTPQGQHVLAALIDISERRRLEQERSETELRYSELINQALEGILVRKPSGEFLFVNDAFCQMLGYARAELLRMSISDVVHPEDAETIAQVQQLKNGGSLRLEKRMHCKDRQVLNVQVSVRRLTNGNFQSTVHDVTEQVQAQEVLRALPKRLLDAQEAERRRIARELHDEVGQALTAAQIRLRDLEAQLRGTASAKDAAEISKMVATLLQQVRQLSLDLRPSVLDDLGLAAAVRWFMRERASQGRMQVELDVPLTLPRPPAQVETAMFRMFQSAMTNILRHAEAGCVRVSLRVEALHLILEIHDDGKGFDLDAARRRARQGGSLGLLGMEEWIHLSGGVFAIESEPGRGTTVRASVPVPPLAEDDLGQGNKGV